MAIPRPLKTKYGMSLKRLAELVNKPLGTLKSMSARDPEGFKIRVDRLLQGGKFDAGAPVAIIEGIDAELAALSANDGLLSQIELAKLVDQMARDLDRVHFMICAAREGLSADIYERFQPILAITANWLED